MNGRNQVEIGQRVINVLVSKLLTNTPHFTSFSTCDRRYDTDELHDEVWASYGDTIRGMGIHSIPLFIFNANPDGGPFRNRVGRTLVGCCWCKLRARLTHEHERA